MDMKSTEANESLDLIWGAEGIGKEIGRNTRQAFFLLEKGLINGARKVGGRWVADRGKIREMFLDSS